jgi:hypothetical protein
MATKSKPTTQNAKSPTGPEVMDQMAANPTLDRFFLNKPEFTADELREFVRIQRAERAIWELKQK